MERKTRVSKDEVDIRVSLGMLLRPLKGRIENSIRARLDDIPGWHCNRTLLRVRLHRAILNPGAVRHTRWCGRRHARLPVKAV